jgi:hypothetical protein
VRLGLGAAARRISGLILFLQCNWLAFRYWKESTPHWKEENELGEESDATFGGVILTSRTL